MKLNFQKQKVLNFRLIGFKQNLGSKSEIAKNQAKLVTYLTQNNDLHLISDKFYFEMIDGQIYGPYIGVIGQKSKIPSDLNVLEFQNFNWLRSNLDNFDIDAQGLLKLDQLFPKIREKIPFKNVFLSLEFDKIELHFFEV